MRCASGSTLTYTLAGSLHVAAGVPCLKLNLLLALSRLLLLLLYLMRRQHQAQVANSLHALRQLMQHVDQRNELVAVQSALSGSSGGSGAPHLGFVGLSEQDLQGRRNAQHLCEGGGDVHVGG